MIDSIQLVNTVTGQSITLDQDNSQFILTDLDLGKVTGLHSKYAFYNQIGVTIESTEIQDRDIAIIGYLIGSTYEDIKQNKKLLNKFVNPVQDTDIIVYNKYRLTFRADYSVQYGKTVPENNEYMCRFLIQGTCGNPLFRLVRNEQTFMSATEPKFKFPWIIPKPDGFIFSQKQTNRLITVENDGDLPVGIKITLTAKGTVINPKVTSILTQEKIQLQKTLSVGETVTISTVYGQKYIQGIVNGVTSNYIKYLKYPSDWFQLTPGSNSIQYDADSGASYLQGTIEFSPGYMEVEE